VDAVIDKDRAGGQASRGGRREHFPILTDVEYALLNFGSEDEAPIDKMSIAEAK